MKNIFIIFIVLCLAGYAFAGDSARKGTTGADQLLIPVGARGIATGGAFLSTLSGIESIYYNPAGLDVGGRNEAMFSYMDYIADINVSYFAAAASLGDLGSIALSFKSMDFGDIPITTVESPDGTGRNYSPSFLIASLSYSKIITDRISVGANFKMISEEIMNTSASGFGIDFGVQYKFDSKLSIGASIKNIGSNMQYDGADLQNSTSIPSSTLGSPKGNFEIVTESFQIPSYFELSTAYNYNLNEQNNIILGSTYTVNNSLEDILNMGLEYSFLKTFFLRGGYNYQMENSDQAIYGFSVGAGIDYMLAENLKIVVDYAYREIKDFPNPNHVFTIKLAL